MASEMEAALGLPQLVVPFQTIAELARCKGYDNLSRVSF